MQLFQRMVFAAVLAGLLAGTVMAGLQQWRVAPLLLAAEAYENPAPAHAHEASAWAPADGAERIGFTIGADLLAALGFAFLLAAASLLSGIEVTARNGALWGLAGFAVFQLAPAFGLPPELPGMPAADLAARQAWWWGTALATATAIFGMAKFRNWPAMAVGAVLVLLPHVIGAPPAPHGESGVPAALATTFAATALGIGAAFWLCLGPLYGYLAERFAAAGTKAAVAA